MKSHNDQTTYQTIKIASLDDETKETPFCGFGIFSTPCRILCGKGKGDDFACFVREKLDSLDLKDRFNTCADKMASMIRKHPLKSLAIAGGAGLVIGMCIVRKN